MERTVAIVGAGAMGAGIAEVAASAGWRALLYDSKPGLAEEAKAKISARYAKRVEEGKVKPEVRDGLLTRIAPCADLKEFVGAELVIEAIIEDLTAKHALFTELEAVVSSDCLLATNTSSLSITELAAGLTRRGRFAGLHFFNPAPLMALVEVVAGLETCPTTVDRLVEISQAWGKSPVRAKSSPGFIVNKGARPFYGEALRLLEEGAADAPTIDAIVRANGFKMGPLELIDLVGLNINLSVSRRMMEAFYGEPRYRPSRLIEERVAAGWLGRKTKRGIYDYADGVVPKPVTYPTVGPVPKSVTIHGDLGPARQLEFLIRDKGIPLNGASVGIPDCIQVGSAKIALTNGAPAFERQVICFDLCLDYEKADLVALATYPGCPKESVDQAAALFQAIGKQVAIVNDSAGMINARLIAMLINEAFDTLHRQVACEADIDLAMQKGLNFPGGPFQWLRQLGATYVEAVLENLRKTYGPHYAPNILLRRRCVEQSK
jgi:3-hydroxybutyryl-CoA dehydrogenase